MAGAAVAEAEGATLGAGAVGVTAAAVGASLGASEDEGRGAEAAGVDGVAGGAEAAALAAEDGSGAAEGEGAGDAMGAGDEEGAADDRTEGVGGATRAVAGAFGSGWDPGALRRKKYTATAKSAAKRKMSSSAARFWAGVSEAAGAAPCGPVARGRPSAGGGRDRVFAAGLTEGLREPSRGVTGGGEPLRGGRASRRGAYPEPRRTPLSSEPGGASPEGGGRSDCISAAITWAAFFMLGLVGALRGSTASANATFVVGAGGSGVSGKAVGGTYACAVLVFVPMKPRWLLGGGSDRGGSPDGGTPAFESVLGPTSRIRHAASSDHGDRILREGAVRPRALVGAWGRRAGFSGLFSGAMKLDAREDRETADEEEDAAEGAESGRNESLKARVDRVASGAALALEVAGLKAPTRPLGKKKLLTSGVLSFLFGPFGWLYAAPLKEAIPAIVVYVGVFWLLNLFLPSLLLVWPLAIVNVMTGVAGALYAWGFNSAGKRVPLVLKEDGSREAPPLRKLFGKKK